MRPKLLPYRVVACNSDPYRFVAFLRNAIEGRILQSCKLCLMQIRQKQVDFDRRKTERTGNVY